MSEGETKYEIDGLTLSLKQNSDESCGDHHVLFVEGFRSKSDAEIFLSKSWSGFMWITVDSIFSPIWNNELQDITYSENPSDVPETLKKIACGKDLHGIFAGDKPVIYEADLNFVEITGSKIAITQSINKETFYKLYDTGICFDKWEVANSNKKLLTALDLYRTHYEETTKTAKFLTLVMVLEALACPDKRSTQEIKLLDKFIVEIEAGKKQYEESSKEALSLISLKQQLSSAKHNSISDQIRVLIREVLTVNADSDVEEVVKRVGDIYGKRSRILHGKILDEAELDPIFEETRLIVGRVLKAKFKQLAE